MTSKRFTHVRVRLMTEQRDAGGEDLEMGSTFPNSTREANMGSCEEHIGIIQQGGRSQTENSDDQARKVEGAKRGRGIVCRLRGVLKGVILLEHRKIWSDCRIHACT